MSPQGKLGFAEAAVVSFQPQPAANSRTSLLQRHLSALGPNQPPNHPTNTHLMLTCLRRDQKVPHWDSTTMEPLQQNSDEQHSGLSQLGHLRPSSDASHAEKAAAVGDKQTGCAGKNDVMSDRGLPWRDLRGALFDALPESWLPLSLPSSS